MAKDTPKNEAREVAASKQPNVTSTSSSGTVETTVSAANDASLSAEERLAALERDREANRVTN